MSRNDKLDFAKGILILGVVYGHILNEFKLESGVSFWLHTVIRTFDMPFFMIISGYLLSFSVQKYDPGKYILNKLSNILFPLVLFSGSASLALDIIYGKVELSGILKSVIGYWFIWAILVFSIIFILLYQIKNRFLYYSLALTVGVLFHLIPTQYDIWNLSYVYPFYYIGFHLPGIVRKIDERYRRSGQLVGVGIFVVLLCFWKTDYTIWNTSGYLLTDFIYRISVVSYRFAIGLTGCAFAYTIYDCIYDKFGRCAVISNIGKTSLINYIIHPILLSVFFRKLVMLTVGACHTNIFVLNPRLSEYVIAPIIAFLISLMIAAAVKWIKKIPYAGKYLFGFNICDAKKTR